MMMLWLLLLVPVVAILLWVGFKYPRVTPGELHRRIFFAGGISDRNARPRKRR